MGTIDRKNIKILWVSLVEFPPLCKVLGKDVPPHCGWLYSSAKMLLQNMPNINMGVIIYSYGKKFQEYEVEGIKYYLIPTKSMSRTDNNQIRHCKNALSLFQPDIIHIHGTEYSLAKAICIANEEKVKIVANIQGLAGPCTRYVDGGLSFFDKIINITPLDFYRGTFLLNTKRKFKSRGKCEEYVIKNVTDIIGRTQWDHDHALTINNNIHYHYMNETLRDSFYNTPHWSYENCKKHTIFVSNSCSPLKGAHQILKALPLVLQKYPDVIVNFCGVNVMSTNIKNIIHFQGYNLYLRRLINKLNLNKHVKFLGSLSETKMKQAFLDTNIYIMPSAIENSSNSLCEAQILGVPVIASYCGGTPTLVKDGKNGYLYRYEEIEMLAQKIIELLETRDFTILSKNEINIACIRHDKFINVQRLIEIYKNILK